MPTSSSSSRHHDQASANVPALPPGTPKFIRHILDFFIFDSVLPEDDPQDVLRKVFIGFAGMGVPSVTTFTTVGFVHAAQSPEGITLGAALTFGSYGMVAVAFAWGLCAVKCMPRWSDFIASVELVVLLLYTCCQTLGSSSIPSWSTAMSVTLCAIMSNTSVSLYVSLFLAFAGFYWSAYTDAHLPPGDPTGTLATVSEPYVDRTVLRRLLTMADIHTHYIVTFTLVFLQQRVSIHQTAQATAMLQVATDLAVALSNYDTAAAGQMLAQTQDNEGGKKGELLRHFQAIVSNLDRYRPHLPNWVIDTCDDDDEENGMMGSQSETAVLPREVKGESGVDTRMNHSDLSLPGSDAGGSGSTLHRSAYQRSSRASSNASTFQRKGSGLRALGIRGTAPVTATIVVAEVCFALSDWQFTGAAGHGLVDRVFEIAAGLSAAVHSFVGDSLRVSWNAASAVAQSETKAARFLARLQQDPGHATSEVWGGACAVEACMQMAGTSRQKALVVCLEDKARLSSIVALGTRFRRMAVDTRISVAAQHAVRCTGAGVAWEGGSNRQGRALYVVLEEFAAPEGDEEWLYTVQQRAEMHAESYGGALSKAVEEIAAGAGVATLHTLKTRLGCCAADGADSRFNDVYAAVVQSLIDSGGC